MRRRALILGVAIVLGATWAWGRAVPDRTSYQGVLRNAAGEPLDASVEMVFRFFDAATGGNEILVDSHRIGGAGPVLVSDGLFQVELGSGVVTDGAAALPGDPFTTLAQVFSGFGTVWMQVELSTTGSFETLSPRTHVVSAPYALRARSAQTADSAASLGGVLPGDFLTTSGIAQTKAGSLQIDGTLTAGGNTLSFGQGSTQVSSASNLILTSGNANSDDLYLRGGNGAGDGAIEILGLGPLNIRSGSGNVTFMVDPTAVVTATLDPAGTLTTTDDLVAGGGEVRFGAASPMASVAATGTEMTVRGGDAVTDDLLLFANNNTVAGSVEILGQGPIVFRSGNAGFQLSGPSAGSDITLSVAPGTLTVSGDVLTSGNDFRFSHPGARVSATSTGLSVIAGDGAADILRLQANDTPSDGSVNIYGNGSLEFFSGSGNVFFTNGNAGVSLAQMSGAGNMTVGNSLTINGNILNMGNGGQISHAVPSLFMILGGGAADADLALFSNSALGNESAIYLFGQGSIRLNAYDGKVVSGQDFWATRNLVTEGRKLYLGADGTTWMERNPTNDHLFIARDYDNNNLDSQFLIFTNVGIMQMRIKDEDEAETAFDGMVVTNGLDYAESFRITDETLQAGEVVVFDPARAGYIARASEPYSSLIAGVISTKPGFVTGSSFDAEEASDPPLAKEMNAAFAAGDYEAGSAISQVLQQKMAAQMRPVALAGRLPVRVDAGYGPIKAGDHLTSSPTPGHAMAMKEAGPSLGVALEGCDGPGPGLIMAFVQRGHYTPPELLAQTAAAQESLAASLEARTPDPVSGIQELPSSLRVVLDARAEGDARFSVIRDGESAEPRAEVFRVDERGDVWAQGAFRPRSMDLAEVFALSEPAGPGDVLAMDPDQTGRCRPSRLMGDRAVVGVVASDPGVLLGADMTRLLAGEPELRIALQEATAAGDRREEQAVWKELESRFRAKHAPVALSGTVMVKVDAGYGDIAAGDLLIASPTPGHAMRAPDPAPEGAVIGKALEPLVKGTGLIRMIVMLR